MPPLLVGEKNVGSKLSGVMLSTEAQFFFLMEWGKCLAYVSTIQVMLK